MQQFDLGLNLSTKMTRKREFLEQMQQIVPWRDLVALIAPYAPEGRTGRPPFPVEMLLHIHFIQQWFTLSDSGMEEALHVRDFVGLSWVKDPSQDRTCLQSDQMPIRSPQSPLSRLEKKHPTTSYLVCPGQLVYGSCAFSENLRKQGLNAWPQGAMRPPQLKQIECTKRAKKLVQSFLS